MSVWWSYALSAASLGVSWLVGEKKSIGWLAGMGLQAAWMSYAVATAQWGFLASAVVFLGMNLRNYAKWRRDDAREGECKC